MTSNPASSSLLRTLASSAAAATLVFGLAVGAAAQSPQSGDLNRGFKALEGNDFKTAAEAFAEAFRAGNADGAFYLGRMLELGMGGQPEMNAATAMYVAGSQKGSPAAKNRLGMLHLEGTGVLQDYVEGAKLICEAADAGEVNAQFNCGALLEEGKGVSKDIGKAVWYFQKSSDKGNVSAKNALGRALLAGDGLPKDVKKAVQLFQQTAAAGNPFGLRELGRAFLNGSGVDKDLIKAHAYLNLAAARGLTEAAPERAEVEKQLSGEQVTEAQRFARAWRPEPTATSSAQALPAAAPLAVQRNPAQAPGQAPRPSTQRQ